MARTQTREGANPGALPVERIATLRGVVRAYAWGSRRFIPELLGEAAPSAEPQAELWLGAHPSGPAHVVGEAGLLPLDSCIARAPESVLGERVAARFGGALPFLLKVLAAEQPLSLQAHPNPEQARAGFERENAAGMPLDAERRSYRDPHHKPELICALTRFTALCGFRPLAELRAHLEALGTPETRACAAPLRERGEAGLEACFRGLWSLDASARGRVLARAVACSREDRGEAWRWVARLAEAYPGDVGALAPLLLNLVELAPFEALFLEAGCLHSYLEGAGVELMANSDNVLRAGLTPKHVDVAALLDTLVFRCGAAARLRPERVSESESAYATPTPEFALSLLRPAPDAPYTAPAERGVEILFCSEGEGRIEPAAGGPEIPVRRGASWLVPAAAPAYRLSGRCTVWRASVPA
jgi:mannose-6-phosphate isomerase